MGKLDRTFHSYSELPLKLVPNPAVIKLYFKEGPHSNDLSPFESHPPQYPPEELSLELLPPDHNISSPSLNYSCLVLH